MPTGVYQRTKPGWRKGKHWPFEIRRKISEKLKGRKHGPMSAETRKKMSEAKIREKHPRWKGGRFLHEGYVLIYNPGTNIQGYVSEHRQVIEKELGRTLAEEEVVHHKNGIKTDNRIENLMLFCSPSEHMKFEWRWKRKRLCVEY